MYETPDDLAELQQVLDDTYARAGSHLREIFSEQHRVAAADLPDLLTGVQVTHLATVTARGEPRVAPVDGLFYRGHLWFGSSPDSVRFRHLRVRPQVSASIARGEEFAVLVHGRAEIVDTTAPDVAPFVDYCLETYGPSWREFAAGAPYARIVPGRIYAYLHEK